MDRDKSVIIMWIICIVFVVVNIYNESNEDKTSYSDLISQEYELYVDGKEINTVGMTREKINELILQEGYDVEIYDAEKVIRVVKHIPTEEELEAKAFCKKIIKYIPYFFLILSVGIIACLSVSRVMKR